MLEEWKEPPLAVPTLSITKYPLEALPPSSKKGKNRRTSGKNKRNRKSNPKKLDVLQTGRNSGIINDLNSDSDTHQDLENNKDGSMVKIDTRRRRATSSTSSTPNGTAPASPASYTSDSNQQDILSGGIDNLTDNYVDQQNGYSFIITPQNQSVEFIKEKLDKSLITNISESLTHPSTIRSTISTLELNNGSKSGLTPSSEYQLSFTTLRDSPTSINLLGRGLSPSIEPPTNPETPRTKRRRIKMQSGQQINRPNPWFGVVLDISKTSRAKSNNNSNGESTDKNDETCTCCGEPGNLLCCDSCRGAFHLTCCDPPFEDEADLPDGEWLCRNCEAKRSQSVGPFFPNSIFSPLIQKIECQNCETFKLPGSIREMFSGVKTDDFGRYVDESMKPPKLVKSGVQEEPDPLKLFDKKGKPILCHRCRTSALHGPIQNCDYCSSYFHFDCLDPPLASLSTLGKKFKCPLHADDLLPISRYRRLKTTKKIDVYLRRGFKNNGDIEIRDNDEKTTTVDNATGYRDYLDQLHETPWPEESPKIEEEQEIMPILKKRKAKKRVWSKRRPSSNSSQMTLNGFLKKASYPSIKITPPLSPSTKFTSPKSPSAEIIVAKKSTELESINHSKEFEIEEDTKKDEQFEIITINDKINQLPNTSNVLSFGVLNESPSDILKEYENIVSNEILSSKLLLNIQSLKEREEYALKGLCSFQEGSICFSEIDLLISASKHVNDTFYENLNGNTSTDIDQEKSIVISEEPQNISTDKSIVTVDTTNTTPIGTPTRNIKTKAKTIINNILQTESLSASEIEELRKIRKELLGKKFESVLEYFN